MFFFFYVSWFSSLSLSHSEKWRKAQKQEGLGCTCYQRLGGTSPIWLAHLRRAASIKGAHKATARPEEQTVFRGRHRRVGVRGTAGRDHQSNLIVEARVKGRLLPSADTDLSASKGCEKEEEEEVLGFLLPCGTGRVRPQA